MSFLSQLFASSDQAHSLGARFRSKRLRDFEELFDAAFPSSGPIRILDLGGTDYFWKESSILNREGVEITLLNLHLEKTTHPSMRAMTGDATDLSQFESGSFDLIFSNSVIEHLYTFENQQKMAEEIQRVGKRFFIQTPNKYFPVEAHYALPFAQHLPKSWVYFLLTKTKLSRLERWNPIAAKQYLDEIRLLDKTEMKWLFPQSHLYQEKVLGLVKSFAAHNL